MWNRLSFIAIGVVVWGYMLFIVDTRWGFDVAAIVGVTTMFAFIIGFGAGRVFETRHPSPPDGPKSRALDI